MNVCIVGGGPAGMMLGFLLARAGVEATVLEKHRDFLRDFRGDTVHPSTIELMHELGLLEEFLARPHNVVRRVGGVIEGQEIIMADFAHLPVKCPYVALMPQWDFLDFIAEHARKLPNFHLHLEAEAVELVHERDRVVGVRAKLPHGAAEFRADLTVGADGRSSTVRRQAGLKGRDLGAPMDALWMRIPRHEDDPPDTLGRIRAGHFLVMINRNSYWQCAYLIRKGSLDEVRQRGLPAFQQGVLSVAPFLGDRVKELDDWDKIKLLTVTVDRLETWHKPGLLCIGDSAHAMSPIGGVGINLAIQDAVAASNLLTAPLLAGTLTESDLAAVQKRREPPTRKTQGLQVFIQNHVVERVLGDPRPVKIPLFLRLLKYVPALRRIPARMIGLGFRPEHIETRAKEKVPMMTKPSR
jgi:2-polyprenyl-6-methoxyphenol hydroxylase-like FAD-dependent oxidoreductase